MGKALGNGYPISCVSVNENISCRFTKEPFRYAQSHQNDPLGCAIGIGVIDIMKELDLVNRCMTIGNLFRERLIQLKNTHTILIKDVRSRGLMLALEMKPEINCKDIFNSLISKGYVVGWKDNVLRFMPPLIIGLVQIDNLINGLDEIFVELREKKR